MMLRIGCAACLLGFATPAMATNFWLSASGDLNIGSALPATLGSVATVNHSLGTPGGSIFVWARPDPNQTLVNWSLRFISINPNVLRFKSSSVQALRTSFTSPPLHSPIEQYHRGNAPEGPGQIILGIQQPTD